MFFLGAGLIIFENTFVAIFPGHPRHNENEEAHDEGEQHKLQSSGEAINESHSGIQLNQLAVHSRGISS